jgi:hypothetical protein
MAGLFREMVDAFSANRRAVPPELAAIRAALEAAGVKFTNGDAPGVTLKKPATFTAVGKVAKKGRYERRHRPDSAEASVAGRTPQGPIR